MFVCEKKKLITTNEISILVQCSLKCGVAFFFASDNVQDPFFGFHFMLFTRVLMKELARILIHIYKIFNGRVSQLQIHVTHRPRGHVTSQKRYISTFTRPTDPKLCRVVAQDEEISSTKSHATLTTWSRDKSKTLYLHFH